jgi:hypothetical protein
MPNILLRNNGVVILSVHSVNVTPMNEGLIAWATVMQEGDYADAWLRVGGRPLLTRHRTSNLRDCVCYGWKRGNSTEHDFQRFKKFATVIVETNEWVTEVWVCGCWMC